MEIAELVSRRPHQSDRRSILVELTPKGQELYHEHDALHLHLTVDLSAKFSDDERAQFLNLLKRVNAEF